MLSEIYDLGERNFGENKVQELTEKEEVLPKDIHWHMIGHLQRNKVKYIIDKVAKQKNIDGVMYIDSRHILSSDYSKIVTISKGRDADDLALINDSEKGDVIVTQDYGVASLALGRSAYAIGNSGLIYDNNNIDKLMFERFLGQKVRRAGRKGGKTFNPKKRTREDDERFERNLLKILNKATS